MNVLVVAFDGLDSEKIDEYGLENVVLEEFGSIDNHTGVEEIKTGELFASFITGETSDVHGVTGVKGWNNPLMDAAEKRVPKREPFYSMAARAKDAITRTTGMERRGYTKDTLGTESFFERIPDSIALNVPAYSVNARMEVFSTALKKFGIEQAEREAVKEYRQRKEEFREEMEGEAHTLLMAHFHYIDEMNHLFGDVMENEEKLRQAYEETDRFAGEILDRAEGKYDIIIFMSDHGMPTEAAHNENAFYACNVELFGDETPHITDFHDKILGLTGAGEVGDLDI